MKRHSESAPKKSSSPPYRVCAIIDKSDISTLGYNIQSAEDGAWKERQTP